MLLRTRSALTLIALVVGLTAASSLPVRADPCLVEVENPDTGVVEIINICDSAGGPGGGEGGGGGGGGGGDGLRCWRVRPDGHPQPLDPTDPDVDGTLTPWLYECNDGTFFLRDICTGSDCPVDAVDPLDPPIATVRERVIARFEPPEPQLRHTFDDGDAEGVLRAVVNAETWWWSDGDGEPVTLSDSDGGTWVTLTATPGDLVVDPGDRSGVLSCDYPGVAFDQDGDYFDQTPGEPRGACVHVYRGRADAMSATASVTWSLTWAGFSPAEGFLSGTLPDMVATETVTFPVVELQSVITG